MTRTWTVYGLRNCDTCRKALKWLEAEGIGHRFVDVRADGIGRDEVSRFAEAAGDQLINRRGTTWRGLPAEAKQTVEAGDAAAAVELCLAQPALIKRPVFERDGRVLIGFSDEVRKTLSAG